MSFRPSRWFALVGKLSDHVLGDSPLSSLVLAEDYGERRLNVDDFDASTVIGEKVNPLLSGLTQQVRGTEGERSTRPKHFSATLFGMLDNDTLAVRCFDI